MLSDVEIQECIHQNKITIEPFQRDSLRAGHYSVHLGFTVLVPKVGQVVDLKEESFQPQYEQICLTKEAGFLLKSGMFVLGQTVEQLAIDTDISILLDGRSTLARLGVSIHQSSMTIPPGQEKHVVTLEIFNAGPFDVRLYPHFPVGKLLFFQSKIHNSIAYKDYGKYAGQTQTTGARLVK